MCLGGPGRSATTTCAKVACANKNNSRGNTSPSNLTKQTTTIQFQYRSKMKIGQQQPAFVVLLSAALFGATIPSTSNAQTTTEGPATAGGTLALTPELLRLAELAVILSHYTFTNASVLLPILSDDDGDSAASQSNMTMFFREEPDAALVSKKGGHCFGAFRGTNGGWEDWQQNLRKGSSAACGPSGCCDVQRGFHQVYFDPSYRQDFENALRECVATCAAEQPCPVVLTGNSQGYVNHFETQAVWQRLDHLLSWFSHSFA